jgi:NRPS condensation-like uncharacterized protein
MPCISEIKNYALEACSFPLNDIILAYYTAQKALPVMRLHKLYNAVEVGRSLAIRTLPQLNHLLILTVFHLGVQEHYLKLIML